MSGSGVFLYCKIARESALLFMLPSGGKLLWMIRFAALTPSSALPFNCGYATEDS